MPLPHPNQCKKKSSCSSSEQGKSPQITPNYCFMRDLLTSTIMAGLIPGMARATAPYPQQSSCTATCSCGDAVCSSDRKAAKARGVCHITERPLATHSSLKAKNLQKKSEVGCLPLGSSTFISSCRCWAEYSYAADHTEKFLRMLAPEEELQKAHEIEEQRCAEKTCWPKASGTHGNSHVVMLNHPHYFCRAKSVRFKQILNKPLFCS